MVRQTTRAVGHQYFIAADPQRVFRAISEPGWLVKWLADEADLSPTNGGRYRLSWKDGPTHAGTVLEFVKGRRITLSWEWPGVALKGTRLQLSVSRKGAGTLFTIEHLGFPRQETWVDLYAGAEWGWTYFAMNLKSVLETGRDLRSKFDG